MQLSLAEIRKRPGRAETLVSKLRAKAPFDLLNGDAKVFDRIAFTESGRVVEINPSKDPRQVQLALEWLRKKASNSKYVILMNDKDRFPITDLVKNGDFGGVGGKSAKGATKGNRADVMECVFAAAVFARFINGSDLIVEQDVISVLDKLKDNKQKQVIVSQIKNKNRKVTDYVTLRIAGSASSIKCLTDKNIQFILADIIQAAAKYANQATAVKWGKMLFENNRRNNVEVIADGSGDQKGLDPNVYVKIDKKKINIELPLTPDAVKSNARVIGGSFEEIALVFKRVLGIDIMKYQNQFFKMREIGGIAGSTKFAYKSLAYEYNKSVKNSRPKTYANIANGMDYTLTKKTPSIIIATTFTKNEAQLFKFANISKLLTAETKAILTYEKNLPVLNIIDSRNKTLLKLQAKQDIKIGGSFMNHYVSKGQLLVELGKYIST